MVVAPTYPGVYVQEVPSGVRTIVGVGTSTALFIGRTLTGPLLNAVRLTSNSDFVRAFGDDGGTVSALARYVRLFFMNGGNDCYVIRIADGAQSAKVRLQNEAGAAVLELTARNPGDLGNFVRARVTYNTAVPESTFNLEVFRWEFTGGLKRAVDREELTNLSMDPASPSYAQAVITQRSKLVTALDVSTAPAPGAPERRGLSISGRPVLVNPAANFATVFGTWIGKKFRMSAEGKAPVEVTIPTGAVANPGDVSARIAAGITTALTANGITLANPVEVRLLEGPQPAAGDTYLLRIRAGTDDKDIKIFSSNDAANDLGALIGFGPANGGVEISAYASRRPAPTGFTFKVGAGLGAALADGAQLPAATTPLVGLGEMVKNTLDRVTLDELNTANPPVLAVKDVPVAGLALGPAVQSWIDGTGGNAGILETLGKIRDAINAYQAANPTTFSWSAELWGHRLAFINTSGDDNSKVGPSNVNIAFTGAAGVAMAGRFTAHVRLNSLGPTGLGLQTPGAAGTDGGPPLASDYTKAYEVARRDIDLFNIMVLPPDVAPAAGAEPEKLWGEASKLCHDERAFLIMDPPQTWGDSQAAAAGVNALRVGLVKDHSAVYWPRLKIVENGREHVVGPAGAMAGLYARVDGTRGVWKAPAGSEADVRGVIGVDVQMSDLQNGQINPVGVNGIRQFPEGIVSWGARTMDGADAFASEYKYVPIRRLALFIEESLYRGLKWVVFEPNDEPLWAQIRLNVGAFMHDLFRKGAFQGTKPSDAYFVKCDKETTTFNDQNLGIVNIWVGFAPLKPAEFVILYLQQIAQKLGT